MVAAAFVARDGFSPGAKNESQSRSTRKVLMGVIRVAGCNVASDDGSSRWDIIVVVEVDRW